MTALFTCSLDNGCLPVNQKIDYTPLWIEAMSKTRLICFSLSLQLQRNKLFDYKLWTEMGCDILFLPG